MAARFSVAQYHRMIDAGIFVESDRVELIHGELVLKMPLEDPAALALEVLNRWLTRLLPDQFAVRCQSPVVLPDSEPEPDFVICTPAESRGRSHPRPEHILVVIEIAATSLTDDRGVMYRLYAENGIPVYWIVNLEDRQVEVYTDPVSPLDGIPHYRTRKNYAVGEQAPLVVAGTTLGSMPVNTVLPG